MIVTGSTPRKTTIRSRPRPSRRGSWRHRRATDREDRRHDAEARPPARESARRPRGDGRCEVANLSRNVVIESADPDGVRGHTMYHRNSTGGISYAEFRHLGKEGVPRQVPDPLPPRPRLDARQRRRRREHLGLAQPLDHDPRHRLPARPRLRRLPVVGHGFFLEDGDGAVQRPRPQPGRAGVSTASGCRSRCCRSTPTTARGSGGRTGATRFTRNVACENDRYGYQLRDRSGARLRPVAPACGRPTARWPSRDVRTLPFLRFEDNEVHSEGLYSFNFGDDPPAAPSAATGSTRSSPGTCGLADALRAPRPTLQFFLMDGLDVDDAAYGVYHPDYDAHVYRNIRTSTRVDRRADQPGPRRREHPVRLVHLRRAAHRELLRRYP